MPIKNFRGYYNGLGGALEELYHNDIITLATGANKPGFEYNREVFERAADWIHERGGFTPEMLKEQPALDVLNETYHILGGAVSLSITQEVPEELIGALENNAFVFSGFKTYHSLSEVGLSLKDDKGGIKPFEAFRKDVEKINAKYNTNYLYAEYNHAVTSSQMAAKWHDFEQDGDRYDLQYRTAGDERVRAEHQQLHNITLPQSDPFWSQFLPPNGWNCRCTVVQVRKNKYPASDSAKCIEIGEVITEEAKAKMFRFNPGKELKLFPDKHPYNKAPKEAKKVVVELAKEIINRKDLEVEFERIAEKTDWFERGFLGLYKEYNPKANGSTDLNGNIFLKDSILKNCISAMNTLKRGGEITKSEALSIATLWHEITHNRNKLGNKSLSPRETRAMECANEFIARKTFPEFYEIFGSKVQHPELMDNRENTSYNGMVCAYQDLAQLSGADIKCVVATLKDKSFQSPLNEQEQCLRSAIQQHATVAKKDGSTLTENDIKQLVMAIVQFGNYGALKSRFDDIINQR